MSIAPTRLGPRPLALHLQLAIAAWMQSRHGLPPSRPDSPPWKDGTRLGLDSLQAAIAGIRRYRAAPQPVAGPRRAVVWQEGGTRLLDGGGDPDAAPVLLIPSLINRASILDLCPDLSLTDHLAEAGLRPLLLDWGADRPDAQAYGIADFIVRRLLPAAEFIGKPAAILGYCMGGTLALALAALAPSLVARLLLIAIPWDFHADDAGLRGRVLAGLHRATVPSLTAAGHLPVDWLQTLFALLDPDMVPRKYAEFAQLPEDSAAARAFIAVEDWLNDGVALPLPAASEALIDWYGENRPALGAWRVAGKVIEARRIDAPTLLVVPERDRIVPKASSTPLAEAMPRARLDRIDCGHIAVIASATQRARTWPRLAEWLAGQPCG